MTRARRERRLQQIWYGDSKAALLLVPLAGIYCALTGARRLAYRLGLLKSTRLQTKVVVVGNLSVGGTGKTPLVIALAERLRDQGLRVGIVTRGYGGRSARWPQRVEADSDPAEVGDEAVLLAEKTGLPVYAGPDRVAAGKALLATNPCDVLVSDDGLQHHALRRDVEIGLVDAVRGLGNGHCLPAGPLREPASRLAGLDAVVSIGKSPLARWHMTLLAGDARRVDCPECRAGLDMFRGQSVHAVAGIGHPERFFAMLRASGLDIRPRVFPDHYRYRAQDLHFDDAMPVLMTEKDAVKCRTFAHSHWWYVPVEIDTGDDFYRWLRHKLE